MGSLYQWEAQPQEKGWASSGKRRWGYHWSSWHTSLRSQQGLRSGPALPGLRLMGNGWMLAAPQLFLQGLQPQVSSYLGPGGGRWSLYLLLETLGQFHVPSIQGAGAVVVRAQT